MIYLTCYYKTCICFTYKYIYHDFFYYKARVSQETRLATLLLVSAVKNQYVKVKWELAGNQTGKDLPSMLLETMSQRYPS